MKRGNKTALVKKKKKKPLNLQSSPLTAWRVTAALCVCVRERKRKRERERERERERTSTWAAGERTSTESRAVYGCAWSPHVKVRWVGGFPPATR